MHKSSGRTIIVVGGGIVGLATAYQLRRLYPEWALVLLEKEGGVGRHQSTHNSGVLHAGLAYRPGSVKARLATAGLREMMAFCRQFAIPHELCGKLVVAADDGEIPRLRELLARGQQNGLAGLEWLGPEGIRDHEPQAAGAAAIRVPEEGIVDYAAVCATLAAEIGRLGGRIVTGARVTGFRGRWRALTSAGDFAGDYLINCAGLHCDRVSRLAGERPPERIVPFRGEYYRLRPGRETLVRHLLYPVPDPAYPFLGVHFTRHIDGRVSAGPNAVLALAREGYHKRDIDLRDLAAALGFPGLWRFLGRHPAMCWDELVRSFSRRRFCHSLQRLVPAVQEADLLPGEAGVRAQAMTPAGDLVQDFLLLERPDALHVLNAPSPAATASLAIGRAVAGRFAAARGLPASAAEPPA